MKRQMFNTFCFC